MVVNQKTHQFWSFFHKNKVDFEDVTKLFEWVTSRKYPLKYLCLDNAGKWKHLHKLCHKYGVTMEYTAPHTPQFNGRADHKYQGGFLVTQSTIMVAANSETETREETTERRVRTALNKQ